MNRRLITFGGSTVGLEYGDGRPSGLVDFLFQHIPFAESGRPWTWLRLEDCAGDGDLYLWQDDKLFCKEHSDAVMANQLMSQVCFTLAYESRDGLLLHAAALMSSGWGILLPGKSGAGKSSLVAWLLDHGHHYLTDEMVYVGSKNHTMSGFPRPIAIKRAGRPLLPDYLGHSKIGSGMLRGEQVDLIAPQLFGASVLTGDWPVTLIIFPRFQRNATFAMRALSKAEAAFELMKCLANARNLANHGFNQVAALVGALPAYALSYADLDQAGRSILSLQ